MKQSPQGWKLLWFDFMSVLELFEICSGLLESITDQLAAKSAPNKSNKRNTYKNSARTAILGLRRKLKGQLSRVKAVQIIVFA